MIADSPPPCPHLPQPAVTAATLETVLMPELVNCLNITMTVVTEIVVKITVVTVVVVTVTVLTVVVVTETGVTVTLETVLMPELINFLNIPGHG